MLFNKVNKIRHIRIEYEIIIIIKYPIFLSLLHIHAGGHDTFYFSTIINYSAACFFFLLLQINFHSKGNYKENITLLCLFYGEQRIE